uniref:Uncharacterized protein n=1 Tax=Oryza barthii TaxID=65489 RepID=A0A0D3GBL3_9ORYZ
MRRRAHPQPLCAGMGRRGATLKGEAHAPAISSRCVVVAGCFLLHRAPYAASPPRSHEMEVGEDGVKWYGREGWGARSSPSRLLFLRRPPPTHPFASLPSPLDRTSTPLRPCPVFSPANPNPSSARQSSCGEILLVVEHALKNPEE